MPTVLPPETVRQRADEIREAFEQFMQHPAYVPRPKARQWQFLRHCLEVLLANQSADFPCDKEKATQYRFEAEDRLTRYYARPGPRVEFTFSLSDFSRAVRQGVVDETYPRANGYAFLVSDERAVYDPGSGKDARARVRKVIVEATKAEFAVYRKLPVIDLTPLDGLFLKGGPAYMRIVHLAEQHSAKKWTIGNRNNPSTHLLRDVKVVRVTEAEAEVRTKEYWYLRWWSREGRKNVFVYDRENTQKYILVKQDNLWLVQHNIYPPHRASAARRKWSDQEP
jgi:hypothetical protein